MTHRERFDAVFHRQRPDRCPWVPRLHEWWGNRRKHGTLPERYREMSLADLHRDLGCGHRAYLGPQVSYREGSGIEVSSLEEGKITTTALKTPKGNLRSRREIALDSSYPMELPLKGVDDFPIMEYILKNTEYHFDQERIATVEADYGDMVSSIFFCYGHAAIQRLILDYLGLAETHYALADYPKETEYLIRAIEEADDRWFALVEEVPLEQVNWGEHIHIDLISVPIFRKYMMPYYQRRNEQLHRAGKFIHCHVDGEPGPLLPIFRESGFDCLEALTPQPQGKLTLDEITEALGTEIILMDGIPATHFLSQTSDAEFDDMVYELLERFQPGHNLVLGISDEISPPGDIERVRRVSEIVAQTEW